MGLQHDFYNWVGLESGFSWTQPRVTDWERFDEYLNGNLLPLYSGAPIDEVTGLSKFAYKTIRYQETKAGNVPQEVNIDLRGSIGGNNFFKACTKFFDNELFSTLPTVVGAEDWFEENGRVVWRELRKGLRYESAMGRAVWVVQVDTKGELRLQAFNSRHYWPIRDPYNRDDIVAHLFRMPYSTNHSPTQGYDMPDRARFIVFDPDGAVEDGRFAGDGGWVGEFTWNQNHTGELQGTWQPAGIIDVFTQGDDVGDYEKVETAVRSYNVLLAHKQKTVHALMSPHLVQPTSTNSTAIDLRRATQVLPGAVEGDREEWHWLTYDPMMQHVETLLASHLNQMFLETSLPPAAFDAYTQSTGSSGYAVEARSAAAQIRVAAQREQIKVLLPLIAAALGGPTDFTVEWEQPPLTMTMPKTARDLDNSRRDVQDDSNSDEEGEN